MTENDYQYAGERFDRTTELYPLRARYMPPRTGTFLSLSLAPYQGNRHAPQSLHKYLYANESPVSNVDPTGLTSIAEMSDAMARQSILAGANGLNFGAGPGLMVPRAEVMALFSVINYITLEMRRNGNVPMPDLREKRLREYGLARKPGRASGSCYLMGASKNN